MVYFHLFQPLQNDRFVIPKSRYDSVSAFISPEGGLYNDTDIPYDRELFAEMKAAGTVLCSLFTMNNPASTLLDYTGDPRFDFAFVV